MSHVASAVKVVEDPPDDKEMEARFESTKEGARHEVRKVVGSRSEVEFREESSQVKLLITNNAFCIVPRATAQSKTGIFRGYGVAEAPPGFQAGWSDCTFYFSLFLFILFAHLEIMQPRHSSP
jgi:hypothetical protein